MTSLEETTVRVEILPIGRMVDSVLAPGQWEEVAFAGGTVVNTLEGVQPSEMETVPAETQAVGVPLGTKTFRFAANVLVYILITGGIMFGLPKALSKTLNTSFPMAAITSGSMWPELKVGSLIFIEGIDGRDAEIGGIVVFSNENNTFTIHRVAELKKNTLITKGDANFKDDKPVPYENVIGRTVSLFGKPLSIPYIGSITVFASNLKQEK